MTRPRNVNGRPIHTVYKKSARVGNSLYRITVEHICGKARCDSEDCPRVELEAAPVGKMMRVIYCATGPRAEERLETIASLMTGAAGALRRDAATGNASKVLKVMDEAGPIEVGCKRADGPGPVADMFPSLAQYLPGATPSHAPNCPKSSQFDRRRRGNLRKCPLGQLGDA